MDLVEVLHQAFLGELEKMGTAQQLLSISKHRRGIRPLRVATWLRKEKNGTMWKHASAGFTQTLVDLCRLGALGKVATELTEATRGRIKEKNFALSASESSTGEPAYPIHDKTHAQNALARVKQHGSPAERHEVYRDIARKYPELATRTKTAGIAEHLRRYEHPYELAGLAALASIGADRIQAAARAEQDATEEQIEAKQLLGGTGHAVVDTAGLGLLAAPLVAKRLVTKRW